MKIITIFSFLVFGIMSCRPIPKEEVDLEKKLFRAMDYADTERYWLAIEVCDSIIAIDSMYDRAYYERAMAYFGLDSNKRAIEDFEKVRHIDPKFPGLRSWYAIVLASENRYLEAAKLQLEELRDYPEGPPGMGVSPGGWANGAEYYFEAGFIDSAMFVLDEYFESYAKNVSVHKDVETSPLRLYAKLLIEKKDFVNAFNKMELAMKSENRVPADYAVWIEVNILVGDHTTAKQVLDYYITEVHDGFESDDAKRLKGMMK
jgi:tetratricopeptide (TPR) repeat protein